MTSTNAELPRSDGRDGADSVRAVRSLARVSRLMERSTNELSMAHYRVLSAIASGEERASRVAERLELGKPTVSAAVESLCAAGFVHRSSVASDQRALALSITEEGAALLDRVEIEMVRRFDALVALTDDPVDSTTRIAELGDALDQLLARRAQRHDGGGDG